MTKKRIVSARWALKTSDRITELEWNSFSKLIDYFGISNSRLVEYALQYTKHATGQRESYRFNSKSFADMCQNFPELKALEASLKLGSLEKNLRLTIDGLDVALPPNTLVRYYPPYIISAEPTYQVRVNLDLSEPLMITAGEKEIAIKCLEG